MDFSVQTYTSASVQTYHTSVHSSSQDPLSYPGGELEVRGQKLLKTIWVSKVTSQGNHLCSVCACVRAYMH